MSVDLCVRLAATCREARHQWHIAMSTHAATLVATLYHEHALACAGGVTKGTLLSRAPVDAMERLTPAFAQRHGARVRALVAECLGDVADAAALGGVTHAIALAALRSRRPLDVRLAEALLYAVFAFSRSRTPPAERLFDASFATLPPWVDARTLFVLDEAERPLLAAFAACAAREPQPCAKHALVNTFGRLSVEYAWRRSYVYGVTLPTGDIGMARCTYSPHLRCYIIEWADEAFQLNADGMSFRARALERWHALTTVRA